MSEQELNSIYLHSKPHAPSVDRINSFKGYTNENIQIVLNLYNTGKGQHMDAEFIEFSQAVVEFNRQSK